VSPNPGDPERNWQRANDNWLKRALREQGTDAHTLKEDYLGRGARISLYDIYVDKNTGQLAIFEQATRRLVTITHYIIP